MENARIKENIGGSRHRYYWESFGKRGFLSTDLMSSGEAVSTWDHIKKWIKDVFLPQGYPDSVSADYLEYQLWDTFQVMCSSLNTSLLLHSTLEASGVGKENASALSATLAWMLRDVSFMFATILFTYAKSTHMSSNCKQWRLFADLANDVALTLKLFSPIIPLPLNLTMSLIGIILALVSAPVVPANTALASHQARRGNLADVQAKNGSQAKLVRLVALGLSAGLISHVSHSFQYKVITSFILMGLHIFANYKAKRIVRIETLNRPRLLILLEKWFSVTRIPSVEEANKSEPLFFGAAYKQNYLPYGFRLKIGSSLREALNSIGETEAFHQFQNLYSSFRHENYMNAQVHRPRHIKIIYPL
ncbi:RUS family member 1-like isoform X2 [Oratosquilla oratoria]|uniref:RUS family member 1-like isoform X2 n=1 Tax=Oratosquilla oratoria TaxID=337810 RepID=UPI003F7607EE